MRLDDVDETYMKSNPTDEDLSQHYHQAEAADITLSEHFDLYQGDINLHNRFERFDIIEDEEEAELNLSAKTTHIPTTHVSSPHLQEEPQQDFQAAAEIQDQYPEQQINQASEDIKIAILQQDDQGEQPVRRRTRRRAAFIMDYEQTVIPGHLYQSWLQETTDIVSIRGRIKKQKNCMSAMKISKLMNLPPVALLDGLNCREEIHYPAPLLELWMRSTELLPSQNSPSAKNSVPPPPEPSSSSPPPDRNHGTPFEYHFEGFQSRVGSESLGASREKPRENLDNGVPIETFMEELRTNLLNNTMVTSENSGDAFRSIPSPMGGHAYALSSPEVNSGRSNKKRAHSSSRHSQSGLDPIPEDNLWQQPEPSIKLARLSNHGLTPDHELLVETGPTQTQLPIMDQPLDKITDSIRIHLKTHFDTPGAPQTESLNQLAYGMDRKGAAQLFYQTCVLTSREYLKVAQGVPYGDIVLSRGAKM